jgi:lipopolysaccharide cholinephosphotransferase
MRDIQLDILSNADIFCRQNNIRYTLTGGTLLGAVRHSGFIPWDDDVDVAMPRPDYNRFVRNFNKNQTYLSCNSYETNKRWCFAYAKIYDNRTVLRESSARIKMAVNIDVFPLDGCFDDIDIDRNRIVPIAVLQRLLYYKRSKFPKNYKKLFVHLLPQLIPAGLCQKYLQSALQTFEFGESEFAGNLAGIYGLREIVPSSVFENYELLPFENKQFFCVKEYDLLLKRLYGDYMQLPPVEKRISHHDVQAHWK